MQLDTFTTPVTAVKLEQDPSVPPEDASVIDAPEFVTTLPPESSTFSTGWVVKTDSDAPATGWVVKTNCVGVPAPVGEKKPLVAVREPDVAVRLYSTPTVPTKLHVATCTTPESGVKLVQNDKVPAEAVRVIAVVDAVTTNPPESSTVTTGWVKN